MANNKNKDKTPDKQPGSILGDITPDALAVSSVESKKTKRLG